MELEPENADARHKLAEILHLGPRWGFSEIWSNFVDQFEDLHYIYDII